jgi:hypothetical protein
VIAIAAAAAGETDRRQRDLRKAGTRKETGVPDLEFFKADLAPPEPELQLNWEKVVFILV